MYRAAQEMMKDHPSLGDPGKYMDVTALLDQGITAGDGKILQYIHKVVEEITDTKGEKDANDDQALFYRDIFALNTEAARRLQQALSGGKLDSAKALLKNPSSRGVDDTPEAKLLSATQEIRGDLAKIVSNIVGAKSEIVDSISRLTGIMAGNMTFASSSVKTMDVLSGIGLVGDGLYRINNAFQKAYAEKGIDEDNSGYSDNAERAKTIQEALKGAPAGIQYYMAMNPGNQIKRSLDRLTGAEDFTAWNMRLVLEGIEYAKGHLKGKSEDDLKREYFLDVASSVADDPRRLEDDILRHILTKYPDKIPNDPKIMNAFESARSTDAYGNGPEISSKGHYDEVAGILMSLQGLVPEFIDVAKALRESNELTVKVER
jgi:hypothetical protein